MLESNSQATPVTLQNKFKSSDSISVDATLFRSIVGALKYLTFTRPDITYAVNKDCQHFSSPTLANLKSVKRILRYLDRTQTFGIRYLSQISLTLYAFSDADWGGCPNTKRSTSGFCVFLGANCVCWCSKKQATVA